ncbi:hypothetical protein MRX96_004996 [Rhipicephalus microplus]
MHTVTTPESGICYDNYTTGGVGVGSPTKGRVGRSCLFALVLFFNATRSQQRTHQAAGDARQPSSSPQKSDEEDDSGGG